MAPIIYYITDYNDFSLANQDTIENTILVMTGIAWVYYAKTNILNQFGFVAGNIRAWMTSADPTRIHMPYSFT